MFAMLRIKENLMSQYAVIAYLKDY